MRKTVKAKQTVADFNKTYKAGETFDINSEDAKALVDKGLVEIVGDAKEANPEDAKQTLPVKEKETKFTVGKEGTVGEIPKKVETITEKPTKAK